MNKERFDFYFEKAKEEILFLANGGYYQWGGSYYGPTATRYLTDYFEFEIAGMGFDQYPDMGNGNRGNTYYGPIKVISEGSSHWVIERNYTTYWSEGGESTIYRESSGTQQGYIIPTENSLNPYEHIDTIKGLRNRGGAFWDNANDWNVAQIDWENKGEMSDGFVGANVHPRLPMPIKLWNSIPYRGKFVAYNSSLLIKTRYKERVKVAKKWVKFVAPVIMVIGAVIAYFLPPVGVAIMAAAGALVAVVGVLLDIQWMTMVGAAIVSGALIGNGIKTGMQYGIGGAIQAAVTSPLTYIALAIQIGVNLYGNSLEAKIKGMQNELKEMEENWDQEVDSRVNPLGGIGKTSVGGDEDFDNFYALMDQEYLSQALLMASDVEISSPVFNDSKYDNTRRV